MKKYFSFFLAVLIPLSFFLIWHSLSNSYPRADESFYFNYSQELYLILKNHGFRTFLDTLYHHKHWKPILHPVFGTFFLFITGGKVLLAIRLFLLVHFALALSWVYRTAKIKTSANQAILLTTLCGLIPWFFASGTTFNSELPFMAYGLGAFFYILNGKKTSDFAKLGFFLFLAAAIRPVEAVLLFTLPTLWFFRNRIKMQLLSIADFIFFAIAHTITFTLLAYSVIKNQNWPDQQIKIILFIWLATCFLLWFAKDIFRISIRGFLLTIISATGILIWYFPACVTLWNWMYVANLGTMGQQLGHRLDSNFFDFMLKILVYWGAVPRLLLLAIFIDRKHKRDWTILWVGLAALTPAAIVGGLSYNGDVRYYYCAWMMCTIALGSLLLSTPSSIWKKVYCTALIFVLGISLSQFISDGTFGEGGFTRISFGKSFWSLRARAEDPIQLLAAEVEKSIENPPPNLTFQVLSLATSGTFYDTLDPWGLSILIREKGHFWTFEQIPNYDSSDFSTMPLLLINYDYFLVGPLSGVANSTNGLFGEYADKIRKAYKDSQWGSLGLTLIRVIDLKLGDSEDQYLLLRTTSDLSRPRKLFH